MLIDLTEVAFSFVLDCIAVGEEREATRGATLDHWPTLSVDQVNDVLADALKEALAQGVEREDIDPSWF
jgi:hypothetical protein